MSLTPCPNFRDHLILLFRTKPGQGFATAVPRVSMSWMNFEAPATVRGAAGTAC